MPFNRSSVHLTAIGSLCLEYCPRTFPGEAYAFVRLKGAHPKHEQILSLPPKCRLFQDDASSIDPAADAIAGQQY